MEVVLPAPLTPRHHDDGGLVGTDDDGFFQRLQQVGQGLSQQRFDGSGVGGLGLFDAAL